MTTHEIIAQKFNFLCDEVKRNILKRKADVRLGDFSRFSQKFAAELDQLDNFAGERKFIMCLSHFFFSLQICHRMIQDAYSEGMPVVAALYLV